MILMPFAVHTTNSRENRSWILCCAWLRDSIEHNFGETSVSLSMGRNLLNPFRAVLFDFEGTIVDFQWKAAEAVEEASAALTMFGFDKGLFNGCNYATLFNVSMEQAYGVGVSPGELSMKLGEIYDRYDLDALDRWRPRDDAAYVLEKTRQCGILTGLVTNAGKKAISLFLQRFRFEQLFDVVVTRNHVDRLKPDGSGILRAMKALKVERGACLYVGDSVNDIKATRSVGIDIAAVLEGESPKNDIEAYKPRFVVDSLSSLLQII